MFHRGADETRSIVELEASDSANNIIADERASVSLRAAADGRRDS